MPQQVFYLHKINQVLQQGSFQRQLRLFQDVIFI